MSFSRVTSALAAGALGVVTLGAMPPAGAAPAPHDQSLAEVLAADGNRLDRNWNDFDVVDRAVRRVLAAKPTSSVGVLAEGSTRVTAFLPTDRAFRALVTDLTGDRRGTERGVLNSVNRLIDVNTLESVLLYHVVPGATITYRQAQSSDGANLATALPESTVRVNVTERHNVFLGDADRNDRNPWVLRAAKDVNKGNAQIAHGIHRVLRPVDL